MRLRSVPSSAVALDSFAASDLRAVVSAYRNALDDNRETLNDLNVYPVPDGDTGTNMALTLGSVVEGLDSADGGLEGTCKAIAHGSLMGARGNSGVIMSQILRGFVGVAEARGEIDGPVFAEALAAAAQGAYTAVGNPVEGTILTVAREASEAALHAAAAGGNLLAVLEAARCEGDASLKRTPTLLPALAEAGVVDAGGLGLDGLGAANLAAVGRYIGVVGHILRLERRDAVAVLREQAAQPRNQQALAHRRSRALNHHHASGAVLACGCDKLTSN